MRALEIRATTVVLVSHDIEDAVFLSDTVYVLSDHPMGIAHEVAVPVERPRNRDDERLAELAREVRDSAAGLVDNVTVERAKRHA